MHTIVFVAAGLAVIISVNVWAANRDVEVGQAASAYQNCVEAQYHMTPIEWYEQTGQYPLCGN